MHIQRFSHFSLRLDCSSVTLFSRIHRKMELCNYHSAQHCGWDFFSNGLRARSFLSNLSSNCFPSSVSLKSQVPKIRTENWETVLDFTLLAQGRLLSRSPSSITGLSMLACTGIFPVIDKSIQSMLNPLISCRRRRLWISKKKTFPDIPCVSHLFGCEF